MPDKSDTGRTLGRLLSNVSTLEEPKERITALAKFISGYEPDIIGPVLGSLISEACIRIEAGITFLSLMDISGLMEAAPDWNWDGLKHYFSKSKQDETWKRLAKLGASQSMNVTAKTSMMMEVIYIMIEDDLLDPESDFECTGADIALLILKTAGSGENDFNLSLSSFPVGMRKFLKEILAELDFIEKAKGVWKFTFTSSTQKKYSYGSNLRSHLGTGQMSLAVAQRNAENLVKRLELLVKTLQMFPSGHPSIEPSTDSFLSVLARFKSENEKVTLSVMGDSMMVNDITVEGKGPGLRSFIRSFSERKISSLTFEPDVSPDEIKTFTKLFNRPPAYISEHGGMDKLVEHRGLKSISVNRFHYQLISDDGQQTETLHRGEVTIEDAIFAELIDRLERGESIDSIPGNKIGNALKSVLAAAKDNQEEQRGMIARFVVALDPTLLERGILSSRSIQQNMAWKAIRKIIDYLLASLTSPDPDVRHEVVGKLRDMAQLAVERGKENSTIQIIENVSTLLKREQDPDVLYRGIVLTASIMESLLSRGMMSIAIQAGKILNNIKGMKYPRTELEAARKRALAEADKRMDTIEAAEALVQRIVSEDEIVASEARRLAMIAPPENLVSQLANIFQEDNRRLRSKAFQMLLRMGKKGLSPMHGKLREIVMAFDAKSKEGSFTLPEQDWYTARNIIQILREIGSPESEEVLADLCKVPDSKIRRECLLALTKVSTTTSESLAMFLINDTDKNVSLIALDILTKQASTNTGFIPKLTDAFMRNPSIRSEIMESFSILGKHKPVIDFIRRCIEEGPGGVLFSDPELLSGAFRIMRRYGSSKELPILENLRDEVEGGFLKKGKIDKSLIGQLKKVIEALQMSDSVIEGKEMEIETLSMGTGRKDGGKKYPKGDDEITILGPDYGINN